MSRRSAAGACPYELPSTARRSTLPPSSNPARGKPEESEKFKLRRARIVRLEQEQMLEDEIAVRIIQGLHLSAIMPFDGVRAEFHDLDGLSWPSPPPESRKSTLRPRPSMPFISRRPQARSIECIPQVSFSQQELTSVACRVKTELSFPDISISNKEIAEAAFASYSQTAYTIPLDFDSPASTGFQRGRVPGFSQHSIVQPRARMTSYSRPLPALSQRSSTIRP